MNGTAYDQVALFKFKVGNYVLKGWVELLGPAGLGSVPERTRTSVGAELFVTMERVLAHPRNFYVWALNWLAITTARNTLTGYELGLIFEHTWHYIFGEPIFLEAATIPECELYLC